MMGEKLYYESKKIFQCNVYFCCVNFYRVTDDDGNYILDPKTGNKIEKEYNIDGHYMTITELIEDKDKRWLKVQTWGEYYYIDYDEWVDGQGLGLVNAIINITKEKD